MKSRLEENDKEMCSAHIKGKSLVAERLIRILKSKIYKHMTAISKNVYIVNLDDIVNKYNKTYHGAIKMKPIDVKPNTYINSNREVNDQDPKFKIGDNVRISRYKKNVPNWPREAFKIKKHCVVKNFFT